MKKLLLTLGFALSAGLLLWAESPSLDGRALVADEGVFPRGLFAKTVGYLPGDSISVTNPANGERVDILVIGSIDPSEGVAVLLSPEAARALSIKKNANNLVKLTKRSGGADEICNGSAVLTNDGSCPPEDESAAQKTVAEIVEEAEESGVPVEEAVAEAVLEAEEEIAEEKAAEESAVEEVAPSETAEVAAENPEEESGEYPQYEEPVVDELAKEADGDDEEFVEANVIDEPAGTSEEVAASEETPAETEPAAEAEKVEDEIVEAEPAQEEPLDEYDAIVLVPSDSRAPESVVEPEPEPEPEPELAQEEPETPAPLSRNAGVAYLNGYGELDNQKYYVQIASCSKAESVDEITSQYAERYPLAVIQQSGRSPVLVGPLNVDEYGVVLERFKAYGFKDAFVKYAR